MNTLHLLLLTCCLVFADAILLEVPGYATIEGRTDATFLTRRPFHKFLGLYYGQKPTSQTRFLPPVPYSPDPDAIYDATSVAPSCTQPTLLAYGDEDCLVVNVFTPQLPGNASDPDTSYDNLLPVMFFIHGGAFSLGSVVTYDADKYMEKDVVLVTIQYRLGPLGWLSLSTDEVPGNAGIFDQIEGLRWTNKFIKYFGGDPNLVTIVGESAGSVSVSLLLLAPQARGLYHRAIGESGSALLPWSIDRKPDVSSKRISEIAGCPTEPYSAQLDCLRTISDRNLTSAYFQYMEEDNLNGGLGFGGSTPVIQVAGAERVLEREPRELFESGQYNTEVPIMFGTNKHEGTFVLGLLYSSYLVPNNLFNDTEYLQTQAVPDILRAFGIADENGELAAALTEKFLANAEMGNFDSMAPGMIDMCSVLFFKEGCHQTAWYHSRFNPNSYYYAFNFEGRNSFFNLFFSPPRPPFPHGVTHADELIYLFPFPTFGSNNTEDLLSLRMLSVWTNFAKYGNPTPEGVDVEEGVPIFPPTNESQDAYMSIDSTWTVEYNFSLTYTVTIDGLNPMRGKRQLFELPTKN